MPGPEGKSFPFCPYCYNNPPFEGIDNLFGASKTVGAVKLGKGAGMPCFLCPHPTCQHSMISQGVCACPECDGTLVLDPVSAPRWRLYCNMCNCLVSLPEGAHRISTTRDHCPNCDSTIIEVDFNKKTTPLKDGATLHIGCILCDELLHSLVEMKHGKSFFRNARHRGRSRGRGRRGYSGRGRGGKKQQDPKMSFRDFWMMCFSYLNWLCLQDGPTEECLCSANILISARFPLLHSWTCMFSCISFFLLVSWDFCIWVWSRLSIDLMN